MNINAAIEQLYAVFEIHPKPEQVTGCTYCCISCQELNNLVGKALDQLSPDDLRSYALNAADTVGSAVDFKYFLPRLFEFAADDAFGWPDPGWVIRRLQFVAWNSWPEAEQQAVRAFLAAWWAHLLDTGEEAELSEGLASLATVEPDLSGYLNTWESGNRQARLKLAHFVMQHVTRLALGQSWNSWASPSASQQVHTWLRSGPAAQAFEAEYDADPDASEAETFIEAAGFVWPT